MTAAPTFYEDLMVFISDWMKKQTRNVKGSEIVGGLEIAKTHFVFSQDWIVSKSIDVAFEKKWADMRVRIGNGEIILEKPEKEASSHDK